MRVIVSAKLDDPLHMQGSRRFLHAHEGGIYMASKVSDKKIDEELDYSLNDLMLRGRVSAQAVEKELPSGDKVVEFRLIVSRLERGGVDTLDIAEVLSHSKRANGSKSQALFIVDFGLVQQASQVVGRLRQQR